MEDSSASEIVRWAPMVNLSHSSLQNHLLSFLALLCPRSLTCMKAHHLPSGFQLGCRQLGGGEVGGTSIEDWREIRVFLPLAPSLPDASLSIPIFPEQGYSFSQRALDFGNHSFPFVPSGLGKVRAVAGPTLLSCTFWVSLNPTHTFVHSLFIKLSLFTPSDYAFGP